MKKTICLTLTLLTVMLFTVSAGALSPGDSMGWVLYTNIVAYIDDVPIRSYNIDGYTYIVAEDLQEYGYEVERIPQDKKLTVSTSRSGTDFCGKLSLHL